MNKIYTHGRLVRSPETRSVGQSTVCNFTIASDRAFKNAQGERDTDFFDVQAWGKLGELVQSYFTKGKEIVVWGEMQSRKYEKDGVKRVAWQIRAENVEFCGSKADNQSSQGSHDVPPPPDDAGLFGDEPNDFEPLDDEQMPF